MNRWIALGALLSFGLVDSAAEAATDCTFSKSGRTLKLRADCTTDESIVVPQGFTLDGRGHTITAVDPPGAHFVGAVIRNGGRVAHVRRVRISASGLGDVCDAGGDALAGIAFDGASGSITGSAVLHLNQRASGCQEGHAIRVTNHGSRRRRVTIAANALADYQKGGILVSGNVGAIVRDNVVTGNGPIATIAQNGIEIAFGARARIQSNAVSDHSYSGLGAVATGILVIGGGAYGTCGGVECPFTTGVRVIENVVVDNDVGIGLENLDATLLPPAEPTANRVIENVVSSGALTNGATTQVGILVYGTRDFVIRNAITGDGYDPEVTDGALIARIYAEPPFADDPVIVDNVDGFAR
jgi:hypothetical protein